MNRRERDLLARALRKARAEVLASDWDAPVQIIDSVAEHIADELATVSGFDRARFIEASR